MTDHIVQEYLQSISLKYAYEETSEMGYRSDLEYLLKQIFESVSKLPRIDHDAKAKGGNKPDFVIRKNDIPILYLEAKDIGVSLDKIEKSEQMSRYFGYANLILTDYVEFRFYRNGIPYGEPISIATINKQSRVLQPLTDSFDFLIQSLLDFTSSYKEPITSGKHLSKIMGGKAQRIRDNVRLFLADQSDKNKELTKVYQTIRQLLVHDLAESEFSDMYAQTLVYGLFAARYHDSSPKNFTRQEARDLIPASNPLLRHFFDHIVGPNFDKRLEYIVNELCEVFSHADVSELMKEYFKTNSTTPSQKGPDPVIHFYEDFLKEYDPELRRKMGAYYTPLPVVQFIVRSVDKLLKEKFNLPGGLADTSKNKNGKHKVQILDPAVGTGTFISAVIGEIYTSLLKAGQKGRWPAYVHNDLLPRLHGFELMMAPYTIAHLKLGMAFKQTGFTYFARRLGIYLTNSLENEPQQDQLFAAFGLAESIAKESEEAAKIKNDTPVMVVIGNPPYSVSSSNKGTWIKDLIKVYKQGLNERKINLDDDYIKFIRLAEYFVEKNKTGIVAMITNNSFIDGITHRQMRKHLLETFDEIYILDLHGNSMKKEQALDGSKDENVFDIQQGVSINILLRTEENKKGLGKIFHSEIYGKRDEKFRFLTENNIQKINWTTVDNKTSNYFYSKKDFIKLDDNFKISELFLTYNSGIQTKRDSLTIKFDHKSANSLLEDMNNLSSSEISYKYHLPPDGRDWQIDLAKKDVVINHPSIIQVQYRPFDIRYTLYTGASKGFLAYPRNIVTKEMLKENIGLCAMKQVFQQGGYSHCLATNRPIDERTMYSNRGGTYLFPLYLDNTENNRVPNFNLDVVAKIEKVTGIVSPEEIFDYIYSVLHSPSYRNKYKEFLKIDFPRIPYPKDLNSFNKLVSLGTDLRLLHLMKSSIVNDFITSYPNDGTNQVEKPLFKNSKVYINETQYFGNVPELAWNFYIGGYQPAQKWLKDRRNTILNNEDLEHYQKIIKILVETDKLMKEIDQISL